MSDGRKRYSIIQLNDWSDRGWGVIDETGALIEHDGLALRLTKDEAKAIAAEKNDEASSGDEAPKPPTTLQ